MLVRKSVLGALLQTSPQKACFLLRLGRRHQGLSDLRHWGGGGGDMCLLSPRVPQTHLRASPAPTVRCGCRGRQQDGAGAGGVPITA